MKVVKLKLDNVLPTNFSLIMSFATMHMVAISRACVMRGLVEVHGQVFTCSEKYIVAFVLGCNMDLVGGGWAILFHFAQMDLEGASLIL